MSIVPIIANKILNIIYLKKLDFEYYLKKFNY